MGLGSPQRIGVDLAEAAPVKVIVVNGPNLGRLGVRQPDVYGRQDLEQLRRLCTQWAQELGLDVDVRQTDDEAQMVQWMHEAAEGQKAVRQDLEQLRRLCTQWAQELGLDVDVRQTDDEAQMVQWMHEAAEGQKAVVMNPAAFTHYSYALADAAHMVLDADMPLIEVHISNPAARDEFRKRSVISPVATGTITGLGFFGYKLALEAVAELTKA